MPLGGEPAVPASEPGDGSYDENEIDRSLVDDVEALIDDGKTYLQAELAFQKSRAGFIASGARTVAILGVLAAVFAVLALVGLTVGLILGLTPLLTAWGATGAVVGALLLGALMAARSASRRWRATMAAVSGERLA